MPPGSTVEGHGFSRAAKVPTLFRPRRKSAQSAAPKTRRTPNRSRLSLTPPIFAC